MRAQGWGILGVAFLMALATASVHADTAAAAADYKQAQQFQTAKQWGAAVKAYQAALAAEPRYIWAYKGLGTTYYLAGDKKGALVYYDRYLQSNPSDTATQAFADKLRASLGAGAAPAAPAPAAAAGAAYAEKSPIAGLSFGLGLDGLLASADDINQLLGSGATQTFQSSFGFGADLAADYGFANGFVIGGKFAYGPNRSHALTYSDGSSDTIAINNLMLAISPGYRMAMGGQSWIDLRLDLGYLMVTGTETYAYNGSSQSYTFTSSGYAVIPQVAYAHKIGSNFGISGGLGYMISSASPVNDDKGQPVLIYSSDGSSKNFAVTTGGPFIRVGFYYFL
jgi:hypothetical protein